MPDNTDPTDTTTTPDETTQSDGQPGQSAAVPSADGQADRLAGQPHADLGSPPAPAMAGVSQLAKLVAAVVAPTTLLTSLLFYFGWSRAYWFYDYFGVHSTLLGLDHPGLCAAEP